jgi:hypothetical protein
MFSSFVEMSVCEDGCVAGNALRSWSYGARSVLACPSKPRGALTHDASRLDVGAASDPRVGGDLCQRYRGMHLLGFDVHWT